MSTRPSEPPGDRALLALAIAASAGLIALFCFQPRLTVDLWWTLQAGDYIREHGDVPRTALWTVEAVRDAPYVCHGWLGALIFSAVAAAFGLDALLALQTAVALAIFASLVGLGRRLGASWLISLAIGDLVLFTVLQRMAARSEIFAYLCFALALHVIAAYTRQRRAWTLAWLAPIALVWVNVHGSFLVLPGLLGLLAAGLFLEDWRAGGFRRSALAPALADFPVTALAGASLALAAAFTLQPYGLDLFRSILEPGRDDSMTRFFVEWLPLPATPLFLLRFGVPAALVAAALLLGRRRISPFAALLATVLALMALDSRRHLTLFGIGSVYLLAEFGAGLELGRRTRRALAALLVGALLVASGFAARQTSLEARSLIRHPSPWITAEGLAYARQLRGNVFNSYRLGGLLIYFGYPQLRVSIDSRAGPYPPEYFHSYVRAMYGSAEALRTFLETHAIDHIVVGRREFEGQFRRRLPELRDFAIRYQDERTVVMSRTP